MENELRMKKKAAGGFSLIELVVVIAVVGILAVVVAPRWQSTPTNLEYEIRRVLNDVRYTQLLSLTTGQRYRWVRVSSTAYQIQDSSGTPIALPTGGSQWTLMTGASFGSFTNLPNNLIVFDSQGTPYTDTGSPGTALNATAVIQVSAGGQTRSIQIFPQTGFGQVT